MMPWALSFVAIWLREGGPRGGYSSFPYATFGPNQIQRRRRRYKTRIYHVRRRFTTNIMAFDCTTDSTVTWAGTIDCQRTSFTKARVPSVRRRARRDKKRARRRHKKTTRPKKTTHDTYDFNYQGIYVPTTWTIQDEPPLDPTSERLSRWFGSAEELQSAIWKPWPRKGPDPLAQFRAIRALSGSTFSRSRSPKKRMQLAMIAAAKLTGKLPPRADPESLLPPALQHRMSVYLNAADDADLPVVIDTGASTSLTP